MSTVRHSLLVMTAAAALLLAVVPVTAQIQSPGAPSPPAPRLGQPLTPQEASGWDLTIFPDGEGLPQGRGTVPQGKAIFSRQCASCHGTGGRGATAEELAGGTHSLTSASPDKTIGLYWPHATTMFDFIRRAMPLNAPGSLSTDDVYALTAYLLHINSVVGENAEMNAETLPKVQMPNRNGFIPVDAP
jgi:mono/diheme cytochrome c family protein